MFPIILFGDGGTCFEWYPHLGRETREVQEFGRKMFLGHVLILTDFIFIWSYRGAV